MFWLGSCFRQPYLGSLTICVSPLSFKIMLSSISGSLSMLARSPSQDQTGIVSWHLKPNSLRLFTSQTNDFSGAIARLIPLSKITCWLCSHKVVYPNLAFFVLSAQQASFADWSPHAIYLSFLAYLARSQPPNEISPGLFQSLERQMLNYWSNSLL